MRLHHLRHQRYWINYIGVADRCYCGYQNHYYDYQLYIIPTSRLGGAIEPLTCPRNWTMDVDRLHYLPITHHLR